MICMRASTFKATAIWLAMGCLLAPIVASTQARADAAGDCNQSLDPDRTIRGCTTAIGRKPVAPAYNNRGTAYDDKGDYDRAIADFSKAIALDPKYVNAYYNRGVSYQHKGNRDQAILDYTKAIAVDPKFVPAYVNRGNVYDGKGD